jgi:arsenite methyltransferase
VTLLGGQVAQEADERDEPEAEDVEQHEDDGHRTSRLRSLARSVATCEGERMPGPPVFLRRMIGRQLGAPAGPLGALVARMLNKGNAGTISAAVEALGLPAGATVADIGFGGGIGLDLLLKAVGPTGHVIGVEPSTDMIARAGRTRATAVAEGRLELREATLGALPFADQALQGWLTVNTIYFVDDLATAATELTRVLRPGGRGVVGMADPEWMAKDFPFVEHGFRVRSVADVVGVLTDAGLSVDHRELRRGDGPLYHLLVCSPGR